MQMQTHTHTHTHTNTHATLCFAGQQPCEAQPSLGPSLPLEWEQWTEVEQREEYDGTCSVVLFCHSCVVDLLTAWMLWMGINSYHVMCYPSHLWMTAIILTLTLILLSCVDVVGLSSANASKCTSVYICTQCTVYTVYNGYCVYV